ncbi:MAG: three-Cys-motif partner protein TcmP [Acetobacteraceae bacterium]|nr:three-Cys-motif partner protein TcmP [Acetobacteraceae bacterium]
MVSIDNYQGREQAYVKHVFLEGYLEALVHKTASAYDDFVYVDGFAGPWQSVNERFEDTSFGIAINALQRAKRSWSDRGREVRMSAFLVERDALAYQKLARVPQQNSDILVKTYNGDFVSLVPKILRGIPQNAFVLFFIDPKGWRIPLRKLKPLLSRPRSEVVFNFMFDFINRAASSPAVITGLQELMPYGNWRQELAAAEQNRAITPEHRKKILVESFSESLMQLGRYQYVAETTVLRPLT